MYWPDSLAVSGFTEMLSMRLTPMLMGQATLDSRNTKHENILFYFLFCGFNSRPSPELIGQ